MDDRFELSFKNKEVRMWVAIMVPTFLAGVFFLIFANRQHLYMANLFPLLGWISFRVWQFVYRRKQKRAL
ncbi:MULTISPECIES: hypothetical protein [Sporosarcina]|uniref:Uncharacterized protein n=1 Tax=Sporosarcina contaminans TaxID=633403 RepID=A0ABW3U1B0_9BACL